MIFIPRLLALLAFSYFLSGPAKAQDAVVPEPAQPLAPAQTEPDKRAFGVLPNYRTAELGVSFKPITSRQKFTIATKDTFDPPVYLVAAFFSGVSQFNNSNPSFGQGFKGYAHRYVCAIADQDLGNFLTEAIIPSAFHQDPRYFRKGHGSVMGRIAYAASRTAVAKNDSGKWTFNAAEFLGNGMVASIGNAYYPDSVGFGPTMQRMFTQIGTDALSQVLKEFWPDIKRKLAAKKASAGND